MNLHRALALLVLSFVPSISLASPHVELSNLRVRRDTVTLSGFNSGGGLAQQLLISYPSSFYGIGVVQQTFYRCGTGDGNMDDFDTVCTRLGNSSAEDMYPTSRAISDIQSYSTSGLIEDPAKLKGKRLYVYAGLSNFILSAQSMLNTVTVLAPYIGDNYKIRTRVQDAGFLFPTDNPKGSECSLPTGDEDKYYIGNCHLNVPYEMLNFLLGNRIDRPGGQRWMKIKPFGIPSMFHARKLRMRPLLKFDQRKYFGSLNQEEHFMAPEGYIYVPTKCGRPISRCHLHFYFHGCLSGSEFTGENHIRESGYLEVGELNGIIMIFPQVLSSEKNDIGCWDSFGYTGPLYATQRGHQIMVMRNMIRAITH